MNRLKMLFLGYKVFFQSINLLDKVKVKISISENKNKCKQCDRTFQFTETIKSLQRPKELCKFVFLSGLIDVNRLIDVSQVNISLCNASCHYYKKQVKTSYASTKEDLMEIDFEDALKRFGSTSSNMEDFSSTFLTCSNSSNMIVGFPTDATLINSETTHTTPL